MGIRPFRVPPSMIPWLSEENIFQYLGHGIQMRPTIGPSKIELVMKEIIHKVGRIVWLHIPGQKKYPAHGIQIRPTGISSFHLSHPCALVHFFQPYSQPSIPRKFVAGKKNQLI